MIQQLIVKVDEQIRRAEKAEAELAEAKPFADALRSRHNGYDPEYRKETGAKEPKSPRAALDQLIGEATAMGLFESKQWKSKLTELREAVALYFECKVANYIKEIQADLDRAEKQLREIIGGEDG